MARAPIIGITMRLELETRRFYLGRDYSEAVAGFGGIPVMIPLIPDADHLGKLDATLDAILLPGSDTDVDPALFGEDPHPKLGRVIPEKDATDRIMLAIAEERRLPVLAICFGMQALNVFRGGSLYQDIESQVPNAIKHEQGKPLERPSHEIKCEASGILEDCLTEIEPSGKVYVNSHHHQAVKTVGDGLVPTAYANDGIIECIEGTDETRFVLGVQWHPELGWRDDKLSRAIFERFIAAASDHK